jgi:hypothetical protein
MGPIALEHASGDGIVPYGTLGNEYAAYQNQPAATGFVPSRDNGVPYQGRGKHCMAQNNTCKGFKARGTNYCIGHLRALEKAEEETHED